MPKRKSYIVATLPYFITFFTGFTLLWWSSNKSVLYSKKLAQLFKLSSLFIGFVVLSISTGIPEFSIVISSIIHRVPHLSVGDIIGSNFTDVSLVLGIPVLFFGKAILIRKNEYKSILFMIIFVTLLMAGIFLVGTLTQIHGIILIAIYAICTWFFWKTRHAKEVAKDIEQQNLNKITINQTSIKLKVSLLFFGSLGLVLVASQLCVHAAINIARLTLLDLETIGFTIVAIGTSLPEIALNVSAVRAKEYSLAIGNSLGSVLSQGSLILGILLLASPQPIQLTHIRNIAPFMFTAFAIVGCSIFFRRKINRIEGTLLLGCYMLFILFNLYLIFF